jgi:glycosyltransferase involved in cell wall biosynthesis
VYLQGSYLSAFYNKLLELDGDIYHAHELWMLESCSIVASQLGKKLVYDSHELEVHRNNNWSLKSNQTRCDYEKRYIYNVDAVFAVSNGCAKEIANHYGLEEVFVLRNTPLLSSQRKSKTGIRESLRIESDSKILIYTGSVTFNRGIEIVLQALVHLPEYKLVTVGPWNEYVKEDLIKLALDLDVQDRFYMHTKVSPRKLISLISGGDIAVIPIKDACLSYRYCMPNKLFEAAFAELPIVASDLPDMKEFITNNKLGVVFENDNENSLVEAIQIVEKKKPHIKMKLNYEKFRNEYCFEKESEILIEKYQELIGNSVTAIDTAA